MHQNDTPPITDYNETPDVRFFAYTVAIRRVNTQPLPLVAGVIPYTVHLQDDKRFADMMSHAINAELRQSGIVEQWDMVKWTTVDHLDDLDYGRRFMRGLPAIDWRTEWPWTPRTYPFRPEHWPR